jgi:hypothetical protein
MVANSNGPHSVTVGSERLSHLRYGTPSPYLWLFLMKPVTVVGCSSGLRSFCGSWTDDILAKSADLGCGVIYLDDVRYKNPPESVHLGGMLVVVA